MCTVRPRPPHPAPSRPRTPSRPPRLSATLRAAALAPILLVLSALLFVEHALSHPTPPYSTTQTTPGAPDGLTHLLLLSGNCALLCYGIWVETLSRSLVPRDKNARYMAVIGAAAAVALLSAGLLAQPVAVSSSDTEVMALFIYAPTLLLCVVMLWTGARQLERPWFAGLLLMAFAGVNLVLQWHCTTQRGDLAENAMFYASLVIGLAIAFRLSIWAGKAFRFPPKSPSTTTTQTLG